MKNYNLKLLFEEAKSRFEHVQDIGESFNVYTNSGSTCYVFSVNNSIFTIGISLTNDDWCVDTNITKTALYCDVQFFFNLIFPACCKLKLEP